MKEESERTKKEKSYQDGQTFNHLAEFIKDDDKYFNAVEALDTSYKLLESAGLLQSKTQFSAAIAQMLKTNIPICDAAAICQTTREYFRKLEITGKIKIIRGSYKKCFIKPADIRKYLEGKV